MVSTRVWEVARNGFRASIVGVSRNWELNGYVCCFEGILNPGMPLFVENRKENRNPFWGSGSYPPNVSMEPPSVLEEHVGLTGGEFYVSGPEGKLALGDIPVNHISFRGILKLRQCSSQ